MKQQTLNGSFSLCGKGLHTGLNLTVTFNPAPENYGYKIRSMSINDAPNINISIDADVTNKLSVARYNAINRICEKYGFTIEETYRSSWEELSENITTLYASQSDDFDFNIGLKCVGPHSLTVLSAL